jgi:phospho-N-acetylmuramoyl-pentapeptide-transferase
MLYKLSELFPTVPWTVFKYVTFRSAGAAITALVLSWLMGPRVIEGLRNLKFRQDYQPKDVRSPGDATAAAADLAKRGTPTMGGVLIMLVLDISVFLWARPNILVILTMLSLLVLAFLGFYDDWLKVSKQSAAGAQSRVKWIVQILLALVVGIYLWQLPSTRGLVTDIQIPFFKDPILRAVPWIGIPLVALTIIGSSNAVNLTDGMDGLAIGCTLIVATVMLILTYLSDNVKLATYLQIPPVRGGFEDRWPTSRCRTGRSE